MEFEKKSVKSEMLRIRVTIDEKRQFQEFFKKHNVSLSDGMRQILLNAIRQDEKQI